MNILIALIGNNKTEAIIDHLASKVIIYQCHTYEEMINTLNTINCDGIILSSEIIVDHLEFFTENARTIPTVTLMKRDHTHYQWIEQIYNPPLHQYCIDRISPSELLNVIQYAGISLH